MKLHKSNPAKSIRYITETHPKKGNPYFWVRVPYKDKTLKRRGKVFSYPEENRAKRAVALHKAQTFRDKHLKEEFGTVNPPDRHTGHKKNAGKNSKSGVVGVCKQIEYKSTNQLTYWVATWSEGPAGKRKSRSKYFSVLVYGDEEAFRLACEMREKMVKHRSDKF